MDPKTNFKLIVIQTELERFKYLVRSFLRARMKKVGCVFVSFCTVLRGMACINWKGELTRSAD